MQTRKKRIVLRTFNVLLAAVRDLLILLLPSFFGRLLITKGDYAFLIHPRDLDDVSRKYTFSKYFNPKLVRWTIRHMWPVIGSRITGLKSLEDGRELVGYLMICPITAEQMHTDRKLAQKRILQTVQLAEKLGCKTIGLGALSASMTRGGEYLVDKVKIGVTTGHAYTTLVIIQTVEEIARRKGINLKEKTVAVLGAAGLMGNPCSNLLAQNGIGRLLMIDRPQNQETLRQLTLGVNPHCQVDISTDLNSLKEADIIVVVTNALSAIVKPEHLKEGAILVDDSQPRNTSPALLKARPDVLILDVVASAPGVHTHFPLDFPCKHDVFTCMGEVLILAAHGWKDNYAIGKFDYGLVAEIADLAKAVGLCPAPFRSFNQLV